MARKVIQISDLHLMADPRSRWKGVPTRESLREVLDYLRQEEQTWDAMVVTGDFTHDEERASYQAARELLQDWLPITGIVPGNHDDRRLMREIFPDRIPARETEEELEPLWFRLEVGHWLLLGLDSHLPGKVPGWITEPQYDRLRAQLTAEPSRPTLIFLHHPPVPVGTGWMDGIALQNPEPLLELVKANPQVKAVCAGHVHHPVESQIGNARFLTVPATSLQFTPDTTGLVPDQLPTGYRVFHLEENTFQTEVKRLPQLTYPPEP